MNSTGRILLMGLALIPLIAIVTTYSAFASEGATFGPQTAGGEPLWRLLTANDAVSTNLSRIEMALTDASLALSETGIDGPRAVAVLSSLTRADSSVIDCITIDDNGTVREVAPELFESMKGENLLGQQHVNDTLKTRQYSGFHFINAVEGFSAIDAEMPVFDRNGRFIGTVSLLFNSSQFFGRVLAPFQPGGDSKLWVSKADDGTILYETDPSQILLNISSPIYQDHPQLLALSEKMISERTGYGTYEFLDQSHGVTIRKGCYWTTIPNKGTDMRLVLTLKLD